MSGTNSAADRLRRLRWVLTGLFTVINAVALIVFAWLFVYADGKQGIAGVDADLNRVTSSVDRLVGFDGTFDFTLVNADELNTACPQFAVLPGGAPAFDPHLSARTCVPMDLAVLEGVATDAVRTGSVITRDEESTTGGAVRVRANPLLSKGGHSIGAVVAVADLGPENSRHTGLLLMVIGGSAVLIAALGVAGHVLSGRSIRPAAAALQQQEVLLAETAHDLRSPIASLRALAESASGNPDQREELLARTVQLSVRMGSIIEGLLMRARLAAGVEQLNVQPVWLDQLVTGVVEEAVTGDAHVTVTAAPTKVDVDPVLVQRAIRNLVDNAVRYGRQPGTEAVVHITVAGGAVTVADHGPGIDPAAATDAFDRFSSTGGSSGLGLPIVRWVAQAHGGTLAVYNADEGGAIFELRLPLSGA
ncbi:HAMP domain-containing sensor histidine kinase [Amycolatopsis sp.]|uniref:sensor histidine kinase n=1 Tax=Amycolatopsis sp. TaxID=37632 RepID=UPI002B8FC616|nr:HAMP domain-containing sensor histidine kinase [Amycolatopsis sp.]HVV08995.1 HAMP domain-containing sensor histidine kinase [Amycolatopsis sp.]